jgi:hypothetical protein
MIGKQLPEAPAVFIGNNPKANEKKQYLNF